MPAGFLADVDQFGIFSCSLEKLRAGQPVVDHHVGGFETLQSFDSDQSRVSRPGADQIYLHTLISNFKDNPALRRRAERSEASRPCRDGILRCAQNDVCTYQSPILEMALSVLSC